MAPAPAPAPAPTVAGAPGIGPSRRQQVDKEEFRHLGAAQRQAMFADLAARGTAPATLQELVHLTSTPGRRGHKPQLRFAALSHRGGRVVYTQALTQGGFGRFHEAWDAVRGEGCALKVLRLEGAGARRGGKTARTAETGMDRELEMMRVAGSSLYTGRVLTRGNKAYLVMPLCRGDLVDLAGIAPAEQRAALAREGGRQVALQLARCHAAGIVHRDIKPDNILYDGAGTLHVADFGAATRLDPEAGHALGFAGTPMYHAPEVLEEGQATPASDVWALGITMFVLTAGRYPVDLVHEDDLAYALPDFFAAVGALPRLADGSIDTAQLRRDPDAPQWAASLAEHGPVAMAFLLDRMLHEDPAQRPSAAAVAAFFAALPNAAATEASARGSIDTLGHGPLAAARAVRQLGLAAYARLLGG